MAVMAALPEPIEAASARECLCCPAILTTTCAPAWRAGLSTDSCMDHQMSLPRDHAESRTNAKLSNARVQPYSIKQRRRSCRRRGRRDARLLRQDKIGSPVEQQAIDVARVRPCQSGGRRAATELFASQVKANFGTDRRAANSSEKLGSVPRQAQDPLHGVRAAR
jgi:hypothetical protein